MSDTIQVGRLRARYHVRGGAANAKERLDAALRRVLDEALETAVAGLGLPAGEEICLRTLHAPARLSLDATDASVAASWSVAIARALREAIASGRDVVRFRSRRHALLDLVRSAAHGDLARGWAWAQLELWDASVAGAARAGTAIAGALCALPDAAPAAVAEVARRGALPALVARLSAPEWDRVARAALRAFGGGKPAPEWGNADAGQEGVASVPPWAPRPYAAARGRAERIAARSRIAAALARVASLEPVTRRALLVLAALEAEPESLTGASQAGAVLAALEHLMSAAAMPAARRRLASEPASGGASTRLPSMATGGEPDPSAPGIDAPAHIDRPVEPDPSRIRPIDPRPTGRTRAGGLLYLLHLVAELGLPDALSAEDGPLAARSLRFSLHALALALIPVEARDPAALAFCGLAPDDEPPSEGADKPNDTERAALEAAAAAIGERLRVRAGREDEPARTVLLETCRRHAEVIADPAWLEIRFSAEDADTRVRRAALDLDPGWLPWLGCIVRFVYA